LLVRIHNPPASQFCITYALVNQKPLSVSANPSAGGEMSEGGFVIMRSCPFTFITTNKVQVSDFHFSVEPALP
jgi:hypothetical protein